ncbi:MAG: hypothetical protein JWM64_2366 [Frankiales bacterium]|nr:hypothetical protein [Frankiales bacterium]
MTAPLPSLSDDRDAVVDAPSPGGLVGALGRVGTGVWLLLVLALVVVGVVYGLQLRSAHATESRRADALQAAKQEALNLTSVDGTGIEQDLQRVLEGASGQFREEFEGQSKSLAGVLKDNKVTAEGKVLDAGLSRFDDRSATAVVIIDSDVSNKAIPKGQTRTYRMQLELERVGDRWLTSSLQFVS